MQSNIAIDLSLIEKDSLVLEKRMLDILKNTRLFFENIVTYLKGKRLTKSNFRIEDPKAVPHFRDVISEILENEKEYERLDTVLQQLKPKRIFLFNMLELCLSEETLTVEQKEEAVTVYKEYLERVVWKLCTSELELARNSARRVGRNITNVTYEDKVGYAYYGLTKAAHKFDFEKGVKFATYASWWIWESILNGCNTEMYFLKIESPMQQRYIKFLSSMRKEDGKENEHLTPEELAGIYSSCNISSVYGDDGADNSDLIIGQANLSSFYRNNPEVLLKNFSEHNSLQEILNNKLDEQEKKLVIGFYGLFDSRKRSIKQLSKSLKLTEDQIQTKLDEIYGKLRKYID